MSPPGTFTGFAATEKQGTEGERNDHQSRVFPPHPGPLPHGEGTFRARITLWGSLSFREESNKRHRTKTQKKALHAGRAF
ncbi:hypothetical protein AB182_17250 [Phytobacter ursingii]|uniref:Uncharacterized protein n=1 Tax=Phytobacter ursingii TaxID=1972431 RepID=A0AAC8QQ79_9ENTR|nr:hypothetical protein AB182_17250 [Phytobacter ursingii]